MRPTRSPSYRWIVAGMAFFAVFAAIGLGRFGYSAVLPSMQNALDLSGAAAGSLASWNQAGYTIMALIGGMLASRFGPRLIVTVGLAITTIGMLLTGLSGGLLTASAARLLTGMGNGMVLPPSIALMASWFGTRRLGMASGIVPAGSSFALVLVGPVVPRLIAGGGSEGWRLAWYFFTAVTAAMTVLAFLVYRDRPYEAKPARKRESSVFRDLRHVVRSRHAWHLGLIYFLYGFAFLLFFTFFQKRLSSDLGYSEETAGNLFLILGIAGVAAGVIWGGISDRIGRSWAMVGTFVLQAAAAAVFALWHNTVALAVWAGIFGICALSMPGLIGAACADKFGVRLAAASLGFVTAPLGIGQALGPYVGGWLEDIFSSLGPSYLLSAGVFLLGAVAALLLRDSRPGSALCDEPGAVPEAAGPAA